MTSLKTIAVLDEKDLADGQVKQVPFEDGQVLLARTGDKVHATSAYCTHYGAPLAKGVFTSDGRIVCPWHGACFNVCTGDIEDAPAPAALHSFKTSISNGKIHVTANPSHTLKDNMSRPSKLISNTLEPSPTPGERGLIIVGGGAGAFHTIESAREHGYVKPIVLLSKEPYLPIDRTKLSKAIITDPSKIEWKNAAELKIRYGVTVRTNVTVTSISPKEHYITLESNETLAYDNLVLAPGAIPRVLPIDGLTTGDSQLKENVLTFRGVGDAVKVENAATEGKTAIVIGSSFISMEVAVAIAKKKLAAIHIIGMEKAPFEANLGTEVGTGIMEYLKSNNPNLKFYMSSTVSRVIPDEADEKRVKGVVVKTKGEDGSESETELTGDFVLMGVGVRPATDFLKGTLELAKDGGVQVDEYLRVKGVEDVYALGDIAIYPQLPTGESRRVEHWNVASNHGRTVGKALATPNDAQPFVKVPVFWSALGQQLRYCGVGNGFEEVIVKGEPSQMKFIAYYVKENKIVAVACMQNDPVMTKASELLRLGLMPTPEEVKGGKDLLSIDISTVGTKPKVEKVTAA
ncbi:hypothetical protein HGRIS_003621 [Hohenbuehelia grisea]|uniref:Rieske domain-containing protein n=1 Tax=Hohenbuehelia grisea TaxID=104357 RepID=A0ABR3JHQ9_9AGAR